MKNIREREEAIERLLQKETFPEDHASQNQWVNDCLQLSPEKYAEVIGKREIAELQRISNYLTNRKKLAEENNFVTPEFSALYSIIQTKIHEQSNYL